MKTKGTQLRGVLTALVTPMNNDGSIDFGALDALVEWQLQSGIQGLVPCGTTGESVTLDGAERVQVIAAVAKKAAGRVPIVAGTGSNSTRATIENQRRAYDAGATIGLVVTPYYNKPTPEGLFRHYCAVADACALPVMIYNVPGRTACDIKPATVIRIAAHTNIIGIKDATGDLNRVSQLRAHTRPDFALLSGDDGTTCAFVLMGGHGVISVASNIAPTDMVEMVQHSLAGNLKPARHAHEKMALLFEALFWEANPIPVKAALAMQNRIQENYRLPLCEMSSEPKEKLRSVLKNGGWI